MAGLSFAYYLKKYNTNVDFVILEKSTRVGGVVFSEKINELVFEWGPRGVRPKGKGQVVLEIVEELGLWDELVFANDKAISSNPSIRHFFLKESTSNFLTLFPYLISCFSKSISISSFLFEYSDNSTTTCSSIFIGKIPFLKQLL